MQANLEDSTGGSVNRKLSNSGGRGGVGGSRCLAGRPLPKRNFKTTL